LKKLGWCRRTEAAAADRPDRELVQPAERGQAGRQLFSSSYGRCPSLSTLQSKYGASTSKRKGVVNAFKKAERQATVDETHLRVSPIVSIGKAQPMLPSGIKGNVDNGRRHAAAAHERVVERTDKPRRRRRADAHGDLGPRAHAHDLPPPRLVRERPVPEPDPDRLRHLSAAGGGPVGPGRAARDRPRGADSSCRRQPFRSCFGTTGTSLKIHNAGNIKPIIDD
jgi:hypothetical protein